MNLLYYYPTGNNAPANLARELFNNLYVRQNELEFEITLFSNKDYLKSLEKNFPDIKIISLQNIRYKFQEQNSFVHIPTSPFVAPNERFFLHIFSLYKKLPLILNYHGDIRREIAYAIKNHAYKTFIQYLPSYFLISKLLQWSQQVIVNSHYMANLIQNEYHIKSRIIPNALNDTWFQDCSSAFAFESSRNPIIFYHGRLSHEKGVDLLIRAFGKAVKSVNSKTQLYIAGTGPQEKTLKSLSNNLNLENNIKFLGFINKRKLKYYIQVADALIYPSRYEPFSLAILEALSMAKGPVYFSNQAGINNFIDYNKYGLLQFKPDLETIYNIIYNILTDTQSNTQQLIDQQKKFAANFTWNAITPQYIKMYKETIDVMKMI